jgi:hypothetical protein
VAESGATHPASGRRGPARPKGFSGSVVFKRLRFRIQGNPNAPRFNLDGFFIDLRFDRPFASGRAVLFAEGSRHRDGVEIGSPGRSAWVSGTGYLFAIDARRS